MHLLRWVLKHLSFVVGCFCFFCFLNLVLESRLSILEIRTLDIQPKIFPFSFSELYVIMYYDMYVYIKLNVWYFKS